MCVQIWKSGISFVIEQLLKRLKPRKIYAHSTNSTNVNMNVLWNNKKYIHLRIRLNVCVENRNGCVYTSNHDIANELGDTMNTTDQIHNIHYLCFIAPIFYETWIKILKNNGMKMVKEKSYLLHTHQQNKTWALFFSLSHKLCYS